MKKLIKFMFSKTWDKICNKRACTCWFDGWFGISWKKCCIDHDIDLMAGLTKSVHEDDNKLFKCVWKKCKIMAVIMWIGVKPMSWIAWRGYRRRENGKVRK